MKKADLHIHSTASDGDLTPEQIVALAKLKGIEYIAITDHNTMDGVQNGVAEGKKLGIKVIPGVELSTRYKGKQVHLLGYFKKEAYKNPKLIKALYFIKKKKVGELNKLLKGNIRVRHGDKRLDVTEGVRLLKMFGATVVIAHPIKISEEDLMEILKNPIDGIEAIHPRNGEAYKYFINLAEERRLIYTAGTDFHSLNKKSIKHGVLGEYYKECEDIYEMLKFK